MKRLVRNLGLLAGLAWLGACAFPGAHRAFLPRLSGAAAIAPGIYSDAPEKAEAQLAAISEGRARAEAFHGDVLPGQGVLCTQADCARRMGRGTPGKAYEDQLFLAGPEGITAAVIGHEFSHIGLHRRIGLAAPQWFGEGLAIWLSPDMRYRQPERLEDALWTMQVRSLGNWVRMTTSDTFCDTYGAAGRVVEAHADELGETGLTSQIGAVAAGEDLDAALASCSAPLDRLIAPGQTRHMLIYKIFRADEWTQLQADGHTAGAPIDVADGYVHFSTGAQVAETAAKYFAGAEGLMLLAVEADGLEPLKWEPSRGGALFPHLYRDLRMGDLVWAKPLPATAQGHDFPEGVLE